MAILLANTLSKKTAVSAPPDRDQSQEYAQTLDAQMNAAPRQYQLYEQYAPQYDQVDLRRLNNSLYGSYSFNAQQAQSALDAMDPAQRADIEAEAARTGTSAAEWLAGHSTEQAKYGDQTAIGLVEKYGNRSKGLVDINRDLMLDMAATNRQANTLQREADIADVERLAPQVQAQIRASNPELYANMAKLDEMAGKGVGSSDIQKMLEQQARDELALGRSLSPEEVRMSQQASRAAFASRGLNSGNASIAEEILGQQQLSDQRLAQRRQFASSIDQIGYGQRVNEAEMGTRNTALATQARQASFFDPYQGVLGRQSSNTGTNAGLAGMAFGVTGQNSGIRENFNPANAYAQDLYNTNYNAKAAANISTANNKAGIYGGAMAADAQVGAAAMSSM